MSFPIAPTNGQITTVNGIKYIYRSATNSWARLGSAKFTAAASAPSNAAQGDRWYNTGLDILFEFINDGTSNYWVDIQSVGQTGNVTSISDSVLNGNIVVGVDNRYSIGASTGYIKNVYANTITSNTTISNSIVANSITTNSIATSNTIVWSGNGQPLTGTPFTVSATPPGSPSLGDQWYNTTNDILYQYISDGTSSYWVDIQSATVSGNTSIATLVVTGNANISSDVSIGSNLTVAHSGLFRGPYNENSILSGVFVGNTGAGTPSPRVGFFNGNTQQNWQIDNFGGAFRWFVPGSSKMTLYDTGNLNVTGGYTVGGKKAVNGPAFRAFIAVGQTIVGNGTQQRVTFGSETFDTDNNFTSSRFTPTVEGYYQLNSTVRISGTAGTGENMLVLYKNGGEYARGTNGSGTEIGANFYSMQVSDIVYANGTTDFFEVYIQQGSGGNRDTTAGTNISYFSGCMIRGA
jgi:hypothetical protein